MAKNRCYILRHCRHGFLIPKELGLPHRVYCEGILTDGNMLQVVEIKCPTSVKNIPSIYGPIHYDRKVFKNLVEINDFFKQMSQLRYKYLAPNLRHIKMPFLYDF